MSASQSVESMMTRDVVTLLEEENLEQVCAKLTNHSFHHLPVVDGGKLVGMLSQRDMLHHTVAGVDHTAAAQRREARYRELTFVRDVMRSPVRTIRPSQTLKEAAHLMLEHRVGALPVTTPDGFLVGIITENDIVRWVAAAG